MKLLVSLGHLTDGYGITNLGRSESIGPDHTLAPLRAAPTTYRIAMGPRAECKVLPFVGGSERSRHARHVVKSWLRHGNVAYSSG